MVYMRIKRACKRFTANTTHARLFGQELTPTLLRQSVFLVDVVEAALFLDIWPSIVFAEPREILSAPSAREPPGFVFDIPAFLTDARYSIVCPFVDAKVLEGFASTAGIALLFHYQVVHSAISVEMVAISAADIA